jgi:hypothetical protein
MDAFISHSSRDMAVAMQVEETLEKEGLKIWLDRSDIRLGVLLRSELQSALLSSRVVILLWSKPAAESRWIASEILFAFHNDRFIIACVLDQTQLPPFLENTIFLDFGRDLEESMARLGPAVRRAPDRANEIPKAIGSMPRELHPQVMRIWEGQREVLNRLSSGDLEGAKQSQNLVDEVQRRVDEKWQIHPMILNLAGYHFKNAYMLEHWYAIQSGRPPKDDLLQRSERYFIEALLANPVDDSALNGLGNILFFERELDAAEFYTRRAIAYGERKGVDCTSYEHDLELIRRYKGVP